MSVPPSPVFGAVLRHALATCAGLFERSRTILGEPGAHLCSLAKKAPVVPARAIYRGVPDLYPTPLTVSMMSRSVLRLR